MKEQEEAGRKTIALQDMEFCFILGPPLFFGNAKPWGGVQEKGGVLGRWVAMTFPPISQH